MTSEPNVDSIFCQAVEIASDGEREEYLEQACGADVALRVRVDKLLAAHLQAGSFMQEGDARTLDLPAERPGSHIGPYKLRERLGEGGMGVVWAAEQKQPLRRKVALKVIKPGMDTEQVIARFEAEREALALMDHPNIARVLDAGTTEQGRPYFVMELIRGVPITEYCDAHKLTIKERLELFTHVCKAVQHAHQKGIIHRDVKPSNVLVTEQDGTAVLVQGNPRERMSTPLKRVSLTLSSGIGRLRRRDTANRSNDLCKFGLEGLPRQMRAHRERNASDRTKFYAARFNETTGR